MNLFSEKPTKICFFAPRAYSYFNPAKKAIFGGAELQIYYFATELGKDEGFDVHVIVKDMDQTKTEIREGVHLHNLTLPEGGGMKYLHILSIVPRVLHMLNTISADIYIQRGASYHTGLIGLFCKLKGKKFIYMVAHDGDTNKQLHPRRRGFIRVLLWWTCEMGLKLADAVIVQNETQRRDLLTHYGRKANYLRQSAHRLNSNVDKETKTGVLWVARGEDWKRPEVFLALAGSFPKEQFTMVMPLSPRFVDLWEKIKTDADRLPNVQFHEFVPPDKIQAFFDRAKVFVNTSVYEGFPNTFIQATKAGTPILSLAVDPNHMIEASHIGICAKDNAENLNAGLDKLLCDQEFWSQCSDNAFHYAHENHDIEQIIKKDKELLLSLINPNPQPVPKH